MKRTRQIYDAFMRAIKDGCVPFGYYGPETCRWATPAEMRRFGLRDSAHRPRQPILVAAAGQLSIKRRLIK
jgi:hypothetical protein